MKIKYIPLYISIICMGLISCRYNSKEGLLILTRVPAGSYNPGPGNSGSWRHIPGTQIIALDPGKPGTAEILTRDFHSACYPEISYDGRYMIFSAKEKESDLWQLFEMEIKNGKSRKITSSRSDCLDPVYLPAGRMAFSRYTVNDTVKSAYCLYTGNLDGSNIRQVTFSPYEDLATTVLKDGRFLAVHSNSLSGTGNQVLTVMRPDGTKADMFYESVKGSKMISRPRQTGDGKILFIETVSESPSENDLVSITYNRPLHSRENLTSEIEGNFSSVLPLQSGKMLVSYCEPGSDHYVLHEFDPQTRTLGRLIYEERNFSVTEVALAIQYERPKKLPSEVDPGVKTGLLLCQDINFKGYQASGEASGAHMASMVEILGIDSTYGVVPVEKDGSFYLKILADTPFQIRTLDEKGNVISGPCNWLWLRPNERRGCVGCHEDPETVPHNRIPDAVKKDPYIIPVHLTRIREKTVELE
ncbi:MAG: hypothetical protein V1903_12415 [Bacteroidota bacterium]